MDVDQRLVDAAMKQVPSAKRIAETLRLRLRSVPHASPCRVCQERLAYWGGDVSVAVPHPGDPARWQAKKLRELTPFYWRRALEPF